MTLLDELLEYIKQIDLCNIMDWDDELYPDAVENFKACKEKLNRRLEALDKIEARARCEQKALINDVGKVDMKHIQGAKSVWNEIIKLIEEKP